MQNTAELEVYAVKNGKGLESKNFFKESINLLGWFSFNVSLPKSLYK